MALKLSPLIKRDNVDSGSSHDPELEIDLKDLFPKLPERADALKQAIGGEILERIRKHAKSTEYFRESPGAKKYSKEYENSLDFKIFGKTKGMKPDLTQSEYMLDDLDFEQIGESKLKFEWDDVINKKKAHGHISGNKKGPGVQRDFFGLTPGDILMIKKEFRSEVLRELNKEETGGLAVKRRVGEGILSFLKRAVKDKINNG